MLQDEKTFSKSIKAILLPLCERYLRPVVNADLNEARLLIVEDAVVGVFSVSVVIELNSPRQALWIFGGHQNTVAKKKTKKNKIQEN